MCLQTVLVDLERKQAAVTQAKDAVRVVVEAESPETREECEYNCRTSSVYAVCIIITNHV